MVNRRKQIEKQYGKAMPLILCEQYAIYGKQKDVAVALGVSQPTVSLWLQRFGLQEKTIVVPKSQDKSAEPNCQPELA